MKRMNKLLYFCIAAIFFLSLFSCDTSCDSVFGKVFKNDIASENATPWTKKEFNNKPEDFKFVVVSDRTGYFRPGVFSSAMGKVNLLQPEFVINVGDLIEGYTEDEAELSMQREEVDGMIDTVEMPFFRVVGNHDMGNDFMRKDWLKRYGRDYYHFIYKNVLFLCLSTEDPPVAFEPKKLEQVKWFTKYMQEEPEKALGLLQDHYSSADTDPGKKNAKAEPASISNEQFEYFRNIIEQNHDVRWTFILLHKPAWGEEYREPNFKKLVQTLGDRPYTVFSGHEHEYQYEKVDNRDYIVLGATGGVMKGQGPGHIDHITLVTMSDNGPEICNLKLDGILDKEFAKKGTGVTS
jgi:predicted phosphodiesterase